MKLGLGTAQFGSDYGVTNRTGQVSRDEIERILTLAADRGLRVLDTAALYGESEAALGACLPTRHDFQIVTKTPQFRRESISRPQAAEVREAFLRSLDRLRQSHVYGLLVHHAADLWVPGGAHLVDALQALRQEGRVTHIGASVYSPDAAQRLPEGLDIVQLPFNLLDQRAATSGILTGLKRRGFEIHARSAFLQGVLLAELDALPAFLARYRAVLWDLRQEILRRGLSPLQAAVGFVAQQPEIDRVVVGVTSAAGLEEIVRALPTKLDFHYDFSNFACEDQNLINPANWVTDPRPAGMKD